MAEADMDPLSLFDYLNKERDTPYSSLEETRGSGSEFIGVTTETPNHQVKRQLSGHIGHGQPEIDEGSNGNKKGSNRTNKV